MQLQIIQEKIHEIRGSKVMLDFDLAALYQVQTSKLNQAVKRNISRFPPDFMFVLTNEELENLRSQNVISSWGGRRYPPYAFTEQGIAMLSGVLKSQIAIDVNISIMRAFVLTRQYLSNYEELKKQILGLEADMNLKFKDVIEVLNILIQKDKILYTQSDRTRIGFIV